MAKLFEEKFNGLPVGEPYSHPDGLLVTSMSGGSMVSSEIVDSVTYSGSPSVRLRVDNDGTTGVYRAELSGDGPGTTTLNNGKTRGWVSGDELYFGFSVLFSSVNDFSNSGDQGSFWQLHITQGAGGSINPPLALAVIGSEIVLFQYSSPVEITENPILQRRLAIGRVTPGVWTRFEIRIRLEHTISGLVEIRRDGRTVAVTTEPNFYNNPGKYAYLKFGAYVYSWRSSPPPAGSYRSVREVYIADVVTGESWEDLAVVANPVPVAPAPRMALATDPGAVLPGLWKHGAVYASGESVILDRNRYRILSTTGAYSSIQINNLLLGKTGKLFQFRLEIEAIAEGSSPSLIMGDDVGNDIVVTGVGTHTGTWVVNGPTATIKRISVVTDVIVKNVQLIEVNSSPVTAADLALGSINVGAAQTITAATLLSGVTDPDGDTLIVTSVTAVSGGTVSGTGPWTITPSETGAGSATVVISDGRGGSANRSITWNGVATNSAPTTSAPVSLGAVSMGSTLVVTAAMLLDGATDPNGDTLSVISPTVTSGGVTISGTGPWTITPTAAGPAAISYQISDGRGGSVTQTALLSVESATTYQRHLDFFGRFRNRFNATTAHIVVPAFTYAGGTDTVETEFGAKLYSDEPYLAGTVEASILTRSAAGTGRDSIFKNVDGSVGIRSTGNVTLTISPPGTWALLEDARFRITDAPGGIQLHKMDAEGVYQHIQTTPRGTFNTLQPTFLMGNSMRSIHGTLYYFAAKKNSAQLYDFRLDEMIGDTFYSAHDPSVVATYVSGAGGSVWRDETPESLAPQPDITVTGSLTQGSTLTITTSSLTFAGGMPQAMLYDDMTGRSGQVGTLATIGAWSSVKTPNANQTYKTNGPGGRPYIVWYDGPTTERVARVWQPGFPFSELFASQQFRVPVGAAWSGSKTKVDGVTVDWTPVTGEFPDDSTLKTNWGLTADDGGNSGSDLIMASHVGGTLYKHGGNSLTPANVATAPTGTFNLTEVMTWGEWMCQQHYAKYNPTDQANGRHVMMWTGSKGKHRQSVSAGSVLCPSRGNPLLNMIINGAWLDVNPLCRMEAAEIYLAAGTNAACRVVIGNSVRWDYCTKMAVSPPLTWAGQIITARAGFGTINPASETAYLYVVGPDGLPINSYGKRLN